MQWDAEEPGKRARQRDDLLRAYARRELGTYSPFYRRHFVRSGVDATRVRSIHDLRPVRPVTWDTVAEDPAAFVVQPSERDLARTGERRVVAEIALAKVMPGRRDAAGRDVVEPRFKPIHWMLADGVPVGSTESDLHLLGEVGARMLSVAGLHRDDVLVDLTDPGPHLAHWQVVLGARHGLVPALHLGPRPDPAAVTAARPTALAGSARALLEVLAAVVDGRRPLADLRVLIVAGEDPHGGLRHALEAAAADAGADAPAVVAAWAPPGVRALWTECPGGDGYHTYPDLEIIEVARGGAIHPGGPGDVIWSALAWRGTVVFRLLTQARVELVDRRCDACGRLGPMVITGSHETFDVAGFLDGVEGISDYQVELRRVNGSEELIVYLALRRGVDVDDLVRELDRDLAATQYVVLTKRAVGERLRDAGSRVVDTR